MIKENIKKDKDNAPEAMMWGDERLEGMEQELPSPEVWGVRGVWGGASERSWVEEREEVEERRRFSSDLGKHKRKFRQKNNMFYFFFLIIDRFELLSRYISY